MELTAAYILHVSTWAMIISSVFTFVSTLVIKAPYGRYSATESKGWGPLIEARLAWILMECPNLIVVAGLLYYGYSHGVSIHPSNIALLGLFVLHYFQRSLIYPAKMEAGQGSPMPASVMILGNIYVTWNAYTQALALVLVNKYSNDWLLDPRFVIGTIIFLFGFFGNIASDNKLLALRKTCKKGEYKIPYGGMFDYVSAANYSCEIIEWTGYAIANWSLPAFAFALYTFSNLGPRGYKHHQWYHQKFENYPKSRKAVIPLLW